MGDHIYVGEGACYGGGIQKLSYTITTDSGTGEPLRIIISPNSYIWVCLVRASHLGATTANKLYPNI